MSDKDIAQGHPVKLRVVVTSIWAHESVILQAATWAIFVGAGKLPRPSTGDYCEVEGVTAAAFAAYVVASRVKTLGRGSMPKPARPTWDQLLNGSMHCQYVELEGVVTMNVSNSITLLTRDGRINVKLHPMGPQLPKTYENAVVQLRGCLIADFGRQSPYVQVGNIFVYQQSFDVVEPAPADVFAIPAKSIADLLRFDPRAGALQRVKVSGQIVHRDNAECFLMDGTNGLRFIPAGTNAAHVCDRVEVAGFPDWNGASPLLPEAAVRRLGPEELPAPHALEAENLLRDDYDSTLVQVTGILVGLASEPDRTVLDMQSGLQRFAAGLDNNKGPPGDLARGSRLELTGVCAVQGGNGGLSRPSVACHLCLNSGYG